MKGKLHFRQGIRDVGLGAEDGDFGRARGCRRRLVRDGRRVAQGVFNVRGAGTETVGRRKGVVRRAGTETVRGNRAM